MTSRPPDRLLLTVKEVCEAGGFSRAWLYLEWDAGRGPERTWVGSHPRVHREDLESWLHSLKARPDALRGLASSKAANAHTMIARVPAIETSPRHPSAGKLRREHLPPEMKLRREHLPPEMKRRSDEASSRFNSH
jgi:predicted DNA-binding transcriptional regulator AlpA